MPEEAPGVVENLVQEVHSILHTFESEFKKCSDTLVQVLRKIASDFAGVDASVEIVVEEYNPYLSGIYDHDRGTIVINVSGNYSFVHLIKTILHEARHVYQHRKLGEKYLTEYLDAEATHGYMDNPFQVDARDYARRMVPIVVSWFYSKIGRKGFEELDSIYQYVSWASSEVLNLCHKSLRIARMYELKKEKSLEELKEVLKSYISDARRILGKMVDCCSKMNEILKAVVGSV